jgi:DNA-binding winged helix-turn-helix (wHTH) protein
VRLQFDDLVVDRGTRQVFRGGEELRLSPKAFDLALLLLESRPRALSKGDLLERLWPATFVAESNLASLVAEIREAIGDDAKAPKYIRTVPRFGYAFCGTVTEPVSSAASTASSIGFWVVWEARQISLREGENVVGREPEAEVWIDSAAVSRRHARISITGRRAQVEDLGSKNGTFVRGTRITGPCEIVDGDQIRLGSVVLRFRMPSTAGSTVSLG